MEKQDAYLKYTDLIGKQEFIRLFSGPEDPAGWFSEKELGKFSFPKHAGSLAARYLIKKRICDMVPGPVSRTDIEILSDPYGKPEIFIGEEPAKQLERAGIKKVLCSVSHSKNYITGMTIFCLK